MWVTNAHAQPQVSSDEIFDCDDGCQCGQTPCVTNNPPSDHGHPGGQAGDAISLQNTTVLTEEDVRIQQLGRYNDERLHGLLHDPKWIEHMEREQRWYDENMR